MDCLYTVLYRSWQRTSLFTLIYNLLTFRGEEIWRHISGTVLVTNIYGNIASLGRTDYPYYELRKLIYGHSALSNTS